MLAPLGFTEARPILISLGLSLLVCTLVPLLWAQGYFQRSELWFYDNFIAGHSQVQFRDERISIVLITEKDIENYDYPLRDGMLARLLEKIESGHPAVIGVDLYRDLPEPRDRSEAPLLAQTLAHYSNILGIFLFGTEKAPFRIPPPPALANDPNRYGFNDFPIDFKTVRRGFLYLPDSCQYTSFDWLVAQYYLATQKQLMPEMDGANVRIGKMEIPRFRPTDGPYVNASNGGYQFLLDFVGPRRFTTRSVGETLALPDAGVFQGQIVILGGGSDSAKDVVDTPLEEGVYGPTVHAQIINQILRGALQGDRPPATFSLFEKGAWEIASCFLGALCGYRIRSYLLYSATLIFGAAGLIALAWLFFISGTWAPVVAPVITFLITAVTVKSYLAYYGEQQRGRLMTLFSQHVAPGVADMLWNERNKFLDGGRPVAKRLTATVLFADLRDFSTLSLEMSPQELMDWLSECLGALGQHVDRNGGVINKYIGDAIMAVYGIPVPRENVEAIARDAANAVNSALGMAGEIHRLNLRWREQGRKEARMRVGIHTGDLMAGVLGSSDRLEYTVIGDSVNVSARLESVDKANTMTGGEIDECRILISETTYDFVKDQFQARFIGSEELKGRKGQTRIFKILAKNADNT